MERALPDRRARRGPGQARRGFSLIELFIGVGVVLILLGLLMPALRGAKQEARAVRQAQTVRSNAALIEMYCDAWKDVFPLNGWTQGEAFLYPKALERAGLLASYRDADRETIGLVGELSAVMTMSAYNRPEATIPGSVLPIDLQPVAPVSRAEVRFPSEKGLVIYVQDDWVVGGTPRRHWFQADGFSAWIARVDQSVVRAPITRFGVEFPFTEEWAGWPVVSTWRGVHGRDVLVK